MTTRRHTETWQGDEWPAGVRAWFHRKVLVSLHNFGHSLDDETFAWVIQWYCDRLGEFCLNADPEIIWVSEYEDDEQKLQYDEQRVMARFYVVIKLAKNAIGAEREANAYDNLDAWLEALHAGLLEWKGPIEKDCGDFVEDWPAFRSAARKRRVRWPRLCRTCGVEFCPARPRTPVKTAVRAGGEGTFSGRSPSPETAALRTPVLLASGLLHELAHDRRQLLNVAGHRVVNGLIPHCSSPTPLRGHQLALQPALRHLGPQSRKGGTFLLGIVSSLVGLGLGGAGGVERLYH